MINHVLCMLGLNQVVQIFLEMEFNAEVLIKLALVRRENVTTIENRLVIINVMSFYKDV